MKIRTRPFRLWWCMSGVSWMVWQRPTSWRVCKNLGQSGKKWIGWKVQRKTKCMVCWCTLKVISDCWHCFAFCLKLCGCDAQEASGAGGVRGHEWIIHSCNLCSRQPSLHCWPPSLYQLLHQPEDLQARRLWRLQEREQCSFTNDNEPHLPHHYGKCQYFVVGH